MRLQTKESILQNVLQQWPKAFCTRRLSLNAMKCYKTFRKFAQWIMKESGFLLKVLNPCNSNIHKIKKPRTENSERINIETREQHGQVGRWGGGWGGGKVRVRGDERWDVTEGAGRVSKGHITTPPPLFLFIYKDSLLSQGEEQSHDRKTVKTKRETSAPLHDIYIKMEQPLRHKC